MPLHKTTFIIFCLIHLFIRTSGQENKKDVNKSYRFAFYNVENYFDSEVDSLSSYHEFDQDGERHWTLNRYVDKRNKIYQVVSAMEGWQQLTMIAFAEIENRYVLEDLLKSTPLNEKDYGIIHFNSEDERGIDLGLVYLKKNLELMEIHPIPVRFSTDPENKTRDILYVKALLGGDTLHVFVNHWPSRYGGLLATNLLREEASKTLMLACDSICTVNPEANLLIMGDFNDEKENQSIQMLVNNAGCKLTGLSMVCTNKQVFGTLKFQGNWNTFDQIFVSKSLIEGRGKLKVKNATAHIFSGSFLLEEDKTYSGLKPNRTYSGYKYNGGFSDHLPVYVDIYTNELK